MGNCCTAESQSGKEVNMQRDTRGDSKYSKGGELLNRYTRNPQERRDFIRVVVKL